MKILLILTSIILASCGGGTTATNPPDTATWSAWSQWSPASNTDTSVTTINQTRTRSCAVTVNGDADSPAPTCSGSSSETRTFDNPLAADTASWGMWSSWTPASNVDTSVINITQTRTRKCNVTVNGVADDPAPTCSGSNSETQTVTNPLAADTATWDAWSAWTPSDSNTDTSVIDITQTRTRKCNVTVNGVADDPAPTCSGSNSETQTVTNPLAADTATWDAWSAWTPSDSNTDTSVINITQTRTRTCDVTFNGDKDDPAPTCSGSNSETQTVLNRLVMYADTASWSAWTPTTHSDTSIIKIIQTRMCVVKVIGSTDTMKPTCNDDGDTSQTQTVVNPLAADTASWDAWGTWTPTNNISVMSMSITHSRTRSCNVMVNGNADESAPTCSGGETQTQTIEVTGNSPTSISLMWSGSGNYLKLYRVANNGTTELIYAGSTETAYTDSNLTAGASYSYQVAYCTNANTCQPPSAKLIDTATVPNISFVPSRSSQQDFDTLNDAGNNAPTGIWSDGTTMWVADYSEEKIYAYTLTTKVRDSSKDFTALADIDGGFTGNFAPAGIWSDGTTMWVADYNEAKIYAYTLTTKMYNSSEDFTNTLTAAGNSETVGIWSDGTTMWVANDDTDDGNNDKIYAYSLATKVREPSKDFNTLNAAGNNEPYGIWSDGTTMWVANNDENDNNDKIYAYNLVTKARDSSKDFNTLTLTTAGNSAPVGIWSDGTTMWVANDNDPDDTNDKIYAYNLNGFEFNASATSASTIEINWNTVAGASIYRVYRSTTSSTVDAVYTALTPTASTTIMDNNLEADTEYFYRISACTLDAIADSSGNTCSDRTQAIAQTSATTQSAKILTGSAKMLTTPKFKNNPFKP